MRYRLKFIVKNTALSTPSRTIGVNYDLNHGFDGVNPLE
ncbi:hypothetical protein ANH9381_1724 [Aggregatibacter actinomycetemcomitans ANH9381]|nr:hypothetical protein ANH9381_1724 [Aggregatibacter actinomycetemcomitans ANH9381]